MTGGLVVSTDRAARPGGAYNQAILAGNLVFIAGFAPRLPGSRTLVEGGIVEQTRRTLENIEAVLQELGLGLEHLVQVTAYLQHLDRDKKLFDETYAAIVPQPWPARATIGAQLAGFLVELDGIAVVPD
ncbi:MAG TPA: Rid family hydrolase [Microbacterium sp.]|jgi:enamine deaminase RidA (YjgF/YER057c/UK114 family)|nr:Rid family hydrolase [Microbacterium sp.]